MCFINATKSIIRWFKSKTRKANSTTRIEPTADQELAAMQLQRYHPHPLIIPQQSTLSSPHYPPPPSPSRLVVCVRKHDGGVWRVDCSKDEAQRWSVSVAMSNLYKRFVFVRAYMRLRVEVSRSHTKVMNLYHKYVMLNLNDCTRVTVKIRYVRYMQPSFNPSFQPLLLQPFDPRYVGLLFTSTITSTTTGFIRFIQTSRIRIMIARSHQGSFYLLWYQPSIFWPTATGALLVRPSLPGEEISYPRNNDPKTGSLWSEYLQVLK